MGPGDLVRPKADITAWLRTDSKVWPHLRAGSISLSPGDLGVVTYYREDNGNLEVLCRGQVCQSSAGVWIVEESEK